jgi:hypothetical protein
MQTRDRLSPAVAAAEFNFAGHTDYEKSVFRTV